MKDDIFPHRETITEQDYEAAEHHYAQLAEQAADPDYWRTELDKLERQMDGALGTNVANTIIGEWYGKRLGRAIDKLLSFRDMT